MLIKTVIRLTDDLEIYDVSGRWRSWDLALVPPWVRVFDIPDPQLPEVRERNVVGADTVVRRVRIPANSQQVDVPVAYPGYLKQDKIIVYIRAGVQSDFGHVPSNLRWKELAAGYIPPQDHLK